MIRDCNSFFEKAGLSGQGGIRDRRSYNTADINTYDIILSVDVMEHIEEDVIVFRNFYNSLQE